jgi:hypothetical protein
MSVVAPLARFLAAIVFVGGAALAASIGADALALIGEETENPDGFYLRVAGISFAVAGIAVAVAVVSVMKVARIRAWSLSFGSVTGSAVLLAAFVAGQSAERTVASTIVGVSALSLTWAVGRESRPPVLGSH